MSSRGILTLANFRDRPEADLGANRPLRPFAMTVEQTSVVDIAYIAKETGIVHLLIADHLQWDGEHLLVLQEKINCYLSFVESGEIFDTLPESKGKDIQIDLIAKYKPTEEALHFLQHAEAILKQAGFGLTHRAGLDCYESAEL